MMEEEASRPIDISSTPLTQGAFRPRFGGSPWLLLFPGVPGLSVFVIIPSLVLVALSLSIGIYILPMFGGPASAII